MTEPNSLMAVPCVPSSLRPYQIKALEWSLQKSSIPLFMEMRLGKSRVAIERLRNVDGRVLVVAPITVLRQWASEELPKWGITDAELILGSKKGRLRALQKGCRWNLVNYEGLRTIPELFTHPWAAVVLDESSRIRNPKTQTSKAIIKHFQNVPIKMILSGNPAPESPLDYFQQFKFLHGKFLGFDNYWSFRNIACFQPYRWKWILKKSFKIRIREFIQKNSFSLSRKEAGIGNEKIKESRTIALEPEQKSIMEKIEKEFILQADDKVLETKFVPVQWTWLAQLSGGFVDGKLKFSGKIKELRELLLGELKEESVVVWFRYNQEIREVYNDLSKKGITVTCVWGDLDEKERWRRIKDFQSGEKRVILMQGKVGLYGIDLSCSSTAIYYSNGFSLETRVQTEDRIESVGKNQPLLIIDLVTENSIDEDIVKSLNKKHKDSQFYLKKEIIQGIHSRNL